MGRRKKGSNKRGGSTLEDAVSGDEQEQIEDEEMFDEVDAFDNRNDAALREAIKSSGRRKKVTKGEQEMYALSGTDSDSDLELPKFVKEKKKKKSKKSAAEAEIQLNDEDFLGSDLEGEEADHTRAWGDRKKHFYGGNTGDGIVTSDSEYSEDEEEEKEADKLMSRQLERNDEEDFIETFIINDNKDNKDIEPEIESSVKKDLSSLTPKERAALFLQQAPEFDGIVFEFKTKMVQAVQLSKIVSLEDSGALPSGPVTEFVRIKFQILVNYCTNICAYLMFKAKGTNLKLHPVTGRLVEYKLLLDSLVKMDNIVQPQVDSLLERLGAGEKLESLMREERRRANKQKNKLSGKKRKLKILQKKPIVEEGEDTEMKSKKRKKMPKPEDLTGDEQMAVNLYQAIRRNKNDLEEDDDENEDDQIDRVVHNDDVELDDDGEEAERRGITYKIAKNKGLMPKRSKLQRNPRVKNRVKFEKAKKRRKGAVREVRTETSKYGGEISGINARVKKGVKIR